MLIFGIFLLFSLKFQHWLWATGQGGPAEKTVLIATRTNLENSRKQGHTVKPKLGDAELKKQIRPVLFFKI